MTEYWVVTVLGAAGIGLDGAITGLEVTGGGVMVTLAGLVTGGETGLVGTGPAVLTGAGPVGLAVLLATGLTVLGPEVCTGLGALVIIG